LSGTANTIDLLWSDNSTNENGFSIEKRLVSGGFYTNWDAFATVAAGVTTYSDTGLQYQTIYNYRVRAYNDNGFSAYSNEAARTTDTLAVANLDAPTFSSATVEFILGANPQVNLVWVDNSTTETAFLIERRAGVTGSWEVRFVSPPDSQTFTDSQVLSGGFYSYRIRAYRSSDTQYSAYSATRSVTVGSVTFGGTLDGKARYFNGVADRLDTGLAAVKGSTNNVSVYCWISKPTENNGTVLGLINAGDADQRFDLNIELSSVAGLFKIAFAFAGQDGNNQPRLAQTIIPVDGRNHPIFIGAVNDVALNRFRFFWGFTADGVVEVPIGDFTAGYSMATTLKQVTDPTCKIQIGALGREGNTAQFFGNAQTIDSVGLEFDTVLTLADMKQRAQCGAGHAASYFWPIAGQDPEEGILAIHGTTIVDSICDVGTEDPELTPIGYGIAHEVPETDAVVPSIGGVIRDNQMSNNAIANMSPNIYPLADITIDNPGTENVLIRRGVVLLT
jgi:hypothetical protein